MDNRHAFFTVKSEATPAERDRTRGTVVIKSVNIAPLSNAAVNISQVVNPFLRSIVPGSTMSNTTSIIGTASS